MQAVARAQACIAEGYQWVVDIDYVHGPSESGASLERKRALRPSLIRGWVPVPGHGSGLGFAGSSSQLKLVPSPLFSPRGEAKCVRGPSVRGARRLTSGGVLDSTSSTPSKCNEVMAGLSRASAVRWVESRTGAGALDAWGVVVPFPVPAHRTGRADFPHPALRPASSLKLSRAAVPGVSGAGVPRPTCQTPPGR